MTPIVERALWYSVLFVSATIGCGAKTELYEPKPLTEEEICDATEGAEWRGGGCQGEFDLCDQIVCLGVSGDGCDCLDPDQCWDGHACVAR